VNILDIFNITNAIPATKLQY